MPFYASLRLERHELGHATIPSACERPWDAKKRLECSVVALLAKRRVKRRSCTCSATSLQGFDDLRVGVSSVQPLGKAQGALPGTQNQRISVGIGAPHPKVFDFAGSAPIHKSNLTRFSIVGRGVRPHHAWVITLHGSVQGIGGHLSPRWPC